MSSKACPACAEALPADAAVCGWCKHPLRAPSDDEEHLRLLSIGFYVSAGITAFLSCVPLLHVAVGLSVLLGRPVGGGTPPPPVFGLLFAGVGGAFVLAGWTLAILKVLAGRRLARRRGRSFCQAVAAVCCAFPPVGTALGVFTLIVLARPSVRALFGERAS